MNRRRGLLRRFLLAGVAAIAATALAQSNPASPQSSESQSAVASQASPAIEVAVIKPHDPNSSYNDFRFVHDRVALDNLPLAKLLAFAYAINRHQIVNAPHWMDDSFFDIDGKTNIDAPSVPQQQEMVKKLLADRFGLRSHFEKREMPVYALEIAKGGPKLAASTHPDLQPIEHSDGNRTQTAKSFTNAAMSDFVLTMQFFLDRPLVDETGLTGRYDFKLTYTYADAANPVPDAAPPLFTAIQEQLGLKFQPMKAATDVLVIDHVERPSPN